MQHTDCTYTYLLPYLPFSVKQSSQQLFIYMYIARPSALISTVRIVPLNWESNIKLKSEIKSIQNIVAYALRVYIVVTLTLPIFELNHPPMHSHM